MLLLNSFRFGASIDITPSAVNWAGGSASTPDPTGRVWSDAQQITGINQTITLSVPTGSADYVSGTVKAWTCDTEGGTYVEADSDTLNAILTFTVTNGKWVKFSFDGATAKGFKSGALLFGVYNTSDGGVALDTAVILNLIVDSGDVYGYDYTPNAITFAEANLNITSATATGAGSSPVSAVLSGTEKPITVSAVLDVQTGGSNVTTSVLFETSADGSTGWVSHGSSTAVSGADGYGPTFVWPIGHTLRISSSATTPDAVARSGTLDLILYNDSDGGAVLDTVSFSVGLNQP